ncbi:hypothetical protein PGT21_006502 [Puccinia graminis f. sp. tritici]|uniref:Uncharacterized protein n=1 Tax=Puccinia graminis f. sp. tritici TaxID=56615 RepID=A0A5B0PWY8_PUCGR|nr:hypothetical protein PGT21_006502 [Puccinia graminis f. sp. tritici]
MVTKAESWVRPHCRTLTGPVHSLYSNSHPSTVKDNEHLTLSRITDPDPFNQSKVTEPEKIHILPRPSASIYQRWKRHRRHH